MCLRRGEVLLRVNNASPVISEMEGKKDLVSSARNILAVGRDGNHDYHDDGHVDMDTNAGKLAHHSASATSVGSSIVGLKGGRHDMLNELAEIDVVLSVNADLELDNLPDVRLLLYMAKKGKFPMVNETKCGFLRRIREHTVSSRQKRKVLEPTASSETSPEEVKPTRVEEQSGPSRGVPNPPPKEKREKIPRDRYMLVLGFKEEPNKPIPNADYGNVRAALNVALRNAMVAGVLNVKPAAGRLNIKVNMENFEEVMGFINTDVWMKTTIDGEKGPRETSVQLRCWKLGEAPPLTKGENKKKLSVLIEDADWVDSGQLVKGVKRANPELRIRGENWVLAGRPKPFRGKYGNGSNNVLAWVLMPREDADAILCHDGGRVRNVGIGKLEFREVVHHKEFNKVKGGQRGPSSGGRTEGH